MAQYNYVDNPNSNLICCICRMPFSDPVTTRTCSHTFCRECIVRAIDHSPHCPVDRSPLALPDLTPANQIVRSLVDELLVECTHRPAGCTYTCQRQLLASHLKDTCQYAQIDCTEDECGQVLLRKDVGKHAHNCVHRLVKCDGCAADVKFVELEPHLANCPAKTIICSFCSSSFPRSDLKSHNETCPDFVVHCPHTSNGCPWKGPRHTLPSHIPSSCPYEAIKGFFLINDSRIANLTEENLALRCKVDILEGTINDMKRQLRGLTTSLGPWYRLDGTNVNPQPRQQTSSSSASHSELSYPTPRRYSFGPESYLNHPNPYPTSYEPYSSPPLPPPSTSARSGSSTPNSPDLLAPYFPPEAVDTYGPHSLQNYTHNPQYQDYGAPFPQIPQSIPSAALDMHISASLESTIHSLYNSIISLSTSLDSLARRNDVALGNVTETLRLGNETLRLNEEVMGLRAGVQGLRMQVHAIMMDRVSQGRPADGSSSGTDTMNMNMWPPPQGPGRFYPPGPPVVVHPTKL